MKPKNNCWLRFIWSLPRGVHDILKAHFGIRLMRVEFVENNDLIGFNWITNTKWETIEKTYDYKEIE